MREIEKQMSAHFVTLEREVAVLMQPNNPYWAELWLSPRTLAERLKDVIRAQEVVTSTPVTPLAGSFAAQMIATYAGHGTTNAKYMLGYKDLLQRASKPDSTMNLREFAKEIKELCDNIPDFCDILRPTEPPEPNIRVYQVATPRNGKGPNGSKPRPTNPRSKNGESIYPPGEVLGCRRCHGLTHYVRDCPEAKAARGRLEARQRQNAAHN